MHMNPIQGNFHIGITAQFNYVNTYQSYGHGRGGYSHDCHGGRGAHMGRHFNGLSHHTPVFKNLIAQVSAGPNANLAPTGGKPNAPMGLPNAAPLPQGKLSVANDQSFATMSSMTATQPAAFQTTSTTAPAAFQNTDGASAINNTGTTTATPLAQAAMSIALPQMDAVGASTTDTTSVAPDSNATPLDAVLASDVNGDGAGATSLPVSSGPGSTAPQ